MKILLASNSPRRKELLKSLGFDFEVVSVDCDEVYPDNLPVEKIAEYLSDLKADAYKNIEFEGKIESLSPASGSEFALIKPDNATGNFVKIEQRFPVKIILKESKNNEKLRTGMNVNVSAEKVN